ncbi:TRAP transporter substrate-binding protein [Marinobacter sp. M3C]|jgi:TRAP-type mannitol/chloroaromatic compound transport system substrate-binding protein|uniref:TRAP transporter substrate-binding protein n=1 Tax=unclassified Marinobacter TaxID=83889 RepID=UPI002010AC35|nr:MULTISPECIES: TRAP transporter substrate-binding protein [unclassified Marinobacter]MCL1476224.1 TRAP transporter substrate-binding protein [Marinobacter sp.]MCL1482979.1 TRAP transporter substrate-binding protein [Marinobacter sp.]MCL1488793.1 TRAP transporter substrate-binding protein [Marinobacter sp.]UQG58124.1 TRAP transporter substrate-binding protein [Marinobacter sp. M4C]UQG60578.1 TRAP transporter substrate-binding protein [Marinobacter sp. M3C]
MKKLFTTAALALAVASPVMAATVDVASTFPKDMLYLGDSLKEFAKSVEAITDGEITFKIHGAGELVPALEVFSAVSQGAVDAGFDWSGYWGGRVPISNLAGAMPFGPDPVVLADWVWEGGGREIIQSEYDKHNIKFLPCVIVPSEPAGWFRKEINSPEDFKGLKFRIGGLGGRVVAKLGASPQLIPGGEVYVALDRGRIDAAEFSLPAIDKTLQLNKTAPYYYFPGWHQPSSINSVLINMNRWNKFSETEQGQLMEACRSTAFWSLTNGVQEQAETLEQLEAEGTEIRRFPDSVIDALRKATEEVIAEESKKDKAFREANESLQVHVERARRWNELQAR